MNVLVSVLGLASLILVHEAGHFFVARAVGMSPRKFYIGFPPALVKVRRGDIEYGLGAIPLGGYVKIPGMHRPAPSDLDAHFSRAVHEQPALERPVERLKRLLASGDMAGAREQLPLLEAALAGITLSPVAQRSVSRGLSELRDALGSDAYWRQRTWKRVAVIVAGPATNVAFAVALLALVYVLGVPVATSSAVEQVVPGSPAAAAGLRAGDSVLAIGGRPVEPEQISETIRTSEGRPLSLTVERGERRLVLRSARPARRDGTYRLGFLLRPEYRRSGPLLATRQAVGDTWFVTKGIGGSLGGIVSGRRANEVSSPVGIVEGSSRALDEFGVRSYLQVLALISLSLALLNLLPLLPLDGGHIMFSLIEGIRGRAIGRAVYERASVIGLVFVLFLFVIGLSNDIERIRG